MLNRVILVGRLTKDPVLKILPSGAKQAEVTIVHNRRYRQGEEWKEEVNFFDVVAYGKLADKIVNGANRGELVIVEGRLRQERWQTEEGENSSRIRVVCEHFRVIQQKKEQEYQEMEE